MYNENKRGKEGDNNRVIFYKLLWSSTRNPFVVQTLFYMPLFLSMNHLSEGVSDESNRSVVKYNNSSGTHHTKSQNLYISIRCH